MTDTTGRQSKVHFNLFNMPRLSQPEMTAAELRELLAETDLTPDDGEVDRLLVAGSALIDGRQVRFRRLVQPRSATGFPRAFK